VRPKENTSSNIKPNEPTKKKTNNRLHARCTSKKTEGLEQPQPKELVDVQPLNQNQEVCADGEPLDRDILASNTFAEPISAMKLVPAASDPVPSDVSLFVFILFQFLVTQ